MNAEDVLNAAREVERLAYLAGAGPGTNPHPDTTPAVHAQLAHAWALVTLAKAIVHHADRLPDA